MITDRRHQMTGAGHHSVCSAQSNEPVTTTGRPISIYSGAQVRHRVMTVAGTVT
jgi:hypothetical protein